MNKFAKDFVKMLKKDSKARISCYALIKAVALSSDAQDRAFLIKHIEYNYPTADISSII